MHLFVSVLLILFVSQKAQCVPSAQTMSENGSLVARLFGAMARIGKIKVFNLGGVKWAGWMFGTLTAWLRIVRVCRMHAFEVSLQKLWIHLIPSVMPPLLSLSLSLSLYVHSSRSKSCLLIMSKKTTWPRGSSRPSLHVHHLKSI